MWTPQERIRHSLPPGGWPTAEEAAAALLYQPIRLGPLELAQRTWVPAMVPWRASPDGEVTEDVVDWYRRFARGQPGAIVVEATGIRDVPSGPLLRIGHDRFVPGLSRIVRAVREASGGRTRLLIQLIDFLRIRRRPARGPFFARFLRVTERHLQATGAGDEDEVRAALAAMTDDQLQEILTPREWEALQFGARERVTDTHLPHIQELPRVLPGLFADAARRAQAAGFDGVELHYAHAYTMASFLSPLNTRGDGYGGDRAGRLRLPLEVYRRVREAVGDGMCVGCRFLVEECITGGGTAEDGQAVGRALARAGMDFLSTSRGGKFEDAKAPKVGEAAYPYTGPSGYECMPTTRSDARGPFGRAVPAVAALRATLRGAGLRVPVVVAGGIGSFSQAEAILRAGQADIIGAARQSLADPDWFRKVRLGRGSEVRRCKYTNYCEALDQRHKRVTCQLWDRLDVGGGPGGVSDDGRRRLVAPIWRP